MYEHQIVKIDDLIPYALNSRTHSEQQVAQIAASIREFGFTNPVLIDDQNNLIAGHGRVLAARKLKMSEVPAIIVTGLDERKRRALIIADNKLALNAGWDEKTLKIELEDLAGEFGDLMGFSKDEIEIILQKQAIESIYSDKLAVPTYEPKNKKPSISDLYDDEKAMDLIAEIKQSKLPQEEKDFLMSAASRHIVFNYSKIADFYAHSSQECQRLMENSALIIVDYKQAIENGFVQLTAQLDDLNDEE